MDEVMDEVVEVITRCDDGSVLDAMAHELVGSGLVACAHVRGPLTSTYRWQGSVEAAQEWELDAVTLTSALWMVERFITANHPYDLPAFIAREVEASDRYSAWVRDAVTASWPG